MSASIPLGPCRPGCTRSCACNRRALRALLVSIGMLDERDPVAPVAPSESRDVPAWRNVPRPIEPTWLRSASARRASRG